MSARRRLSFGLTPCPNDTYFAGAVALGRIGLTDADLAITLEDIEALNEAALARRYDIVKVSCALFAELSDDYALLDVGAAVADDYGPLILTRTAMSPADLATARVVAPGARTTGAALCRLYAPGTRLEHRRYDAIMPALLRGDFDAGVVIHEARLTYRDHGLHCLVDLGAWWRATTKLPVALGCYLMRRELHARYGAAFEALMRESLALAAAGDDPAIAAYIRRHAQEMDERVLRDYIALYVTARTHTLGANGRAAVHALGDRLRAAAT